MTEFLNTLKSERFSLKPDVLMTPGASPGVTRVHGASDQYRPRSR